MLFDFIIRITYQFALEITLKVTLYRQTDIRFKICDHNKPYNTLFESVAQLLTNLSSKVALCRQTDTRFKCCELNKPYYTLADFVLDSATPKTHIKCYLTLLFGFLSI